MRKRVSLIILPLAVALAAAAGAPAAAPDSRRGDDTGAPALGGPAVDSQLTNWRGRDGRQALSYGPESAWGWSAAFAIVSFLAAACARPTLAQQGPGRVREMGRQWRALNG